MDVDTKYKTVVNRGNVLNKSGRHNSSSKCDCDFDSELGHYRDVEVMYDGYRYVFYHSTAIIVESPDGEYRLSSGGWKTKSTKERINRNLPSGYKLVQEDYDWFIQTQESMINFRSGMVIEDK